jgi:hypothetical protein
MLYRGETSKDQYNVASRIEANVNLHRVNVVEV